MNQSLRNLSYHLCWKYVAEIENFSSVLIPGLVIDILQILLNNTKAWEQKDRPRIVPELISGESRLQTLLRVDSAGEIENLSSVMDILKMFLNKHTKGLNKRILRIVDEPVSGKSSLQILLRLNPGGEKP